MIAFVALVIITSQNISAQYDNHFYPADSTVAYIGITTNTDLWSTKDSTIAPSFFKVLTQGFFVKSVNSTHDDAISGGLIWADANGKFFRVSKPVSTQSVSRSFNSSFRPSTTKSSLVSYSVEISSTLSLTAGQTGRIYLEVSPDNATWTEVCHETNSNTGTLIIGLNTAQIGGGVLSGYVPQGYYVRLRTNGTSTFTYSTGQETILF